MSLTKLNIPDQLNVGFNKRKDTYSGRLAYVTYFDQKGKLRKEKSWNTWRDKKIANEILKNEPTAGFVLNKNVGGERWGWNPRITWVRVYDPRGFEFEIKVANLLFLLEECTSVKGKGLDGECVYAWDGADLVLLPTCSEEYKASAKHTANQAKKVTKDQMAEGHIYRTKKGFEVIYLGRHTWHYETQEYKDFPRSAAAIAKDQKIYDQEVERCKKIYGPTIRNYEWYVRAHKPKTTESRRVNVPHINKRHIFLILDKKEHPYGLDYRDQWRTKIPYWVQSGFTGLSECLSEAPDPRYAEAYETLLTSPYITGKRVKQKKKKQTTKKKTAAKKTKKKKVRK